MFAFAVLSNEKNVETERGKKKRDPGACMFLGCNRMKQSRRRGHEQDKRMVEKLDQSHHPPQDYGSIASSDVQLII